MIESELGIISSQIINTKS